MQRRGGKRGCTSRHRNGFQDSISSHLFFDSPPIEGGQGIGPQIARRPGYKHLFLSSLHPLSSVTFFPFHFTWRLEFPSARKSLELIAPRAAHRGLIGLAWVSTAFSDFSHATRSLGAPTVYSIYPTEHLNRLKHNANQHPVMDKRGWILACASGLACGELGKN